MSRIGKKPIDIPAGVDVKLLENTIKIKGPKGELQWNLPSGTKASVAENKVLVERENDLKKNRALHGLSRNLIANNDRISEGPGDCWCGFQGTGPGQQDSPVTRIFPSGRV
jgi:ribosomal protein L6P/L9E